MTPVQVAIWRPARFKTAMAFRAYPIVLLLNRPSLSWLGDLLYDIALRCNGAAITFAGKEGLTRAEEHFLYRNRGKLQDGVLVDVGANQGAYTHFLKKLALNSQVLPSGHTPSRLAASIKK